MDAPERIQVRPDRTLEADAFQVGGELHLRLRETVSAFDRSQPPDNPAVAMCSAWVISREHQRALRGVHLHHDHGLAILGHRKRVAVECPDVGSDLYLERSV